MNKVGNLNAVPMDQIELEKIDKEPIEIDIFQVASQAFNALHNAISSITEKTMRFTGVLFSSGASLVTNSMLTTLVGVTKLTGFTILTTVVIGNLTKPLHKANVSLSKYSITPFSEWANILNEENKRITDSEKVFWLKDGKRPIFSLTNYGKRAHDSFKAAIAPIWLALTVANTALWVLAKPLYIPILIPGLLADSILIAPIALNKAVGSLTYSPLNQVSNKFYHNHMNFIEGAGSIFNECD